MIWSSSDTTNAQISNDVTNPGASIVVGSPASTKAVTITATVGTVSGTATLNVHPTGFVTAGNMTLPRFFHTATLLNDGRVLIAGGFLQFEGTVTATAEIYDPATGASTPTGSMTTPRQDHTATLLQNGMVLISGGADNSGTVLTSSELYDPDTGTFATTGSMGTPRVNYTATLCKMERYSSSVARIHSRAQPNCTIRLQVPFLRPAVC